MRYPKYIQASGGQSPESIVKGYVDFFDQNEAEYLSYSDRNSYGILQRVSRLLGAGCLHAASMANPQKATRTFADARNRLIAAASGDTNSNMQNSAKELDVLAWMLQNRDKPTIVEKARALLHTQTVHAISSMRTTLQKGPLSNGEYRTTRGTLAHKIALGLFTRYKHPHLMATPALAHHESSDQKGANYDILLTESTPHQPESTSYKLQVKCGCIGACGEQPRRQAQERYNQDIVLVSACCDLRTADERSTDLADLKVVDLLVREYYGNITDEEVLELDDYTNSLMLSVTMGDPRRMGSIPLYTPDQAVQTA